MRVIAGIAGGQPLVAPRDSATRPITDRVKETLFAILGDRVPDARVLDLYAGSGAVGIEALSRGAAHATFVEHARPALAALRTNLERTRLGAAARVEPIDVERFLASQPEDSWDLVFLDPPYEVRAIVAPLQAVAGQTARDATVVVKHFWRTDIPEVAGLAAVRQRRFGETMLSFLEAKGR
jgi:16S rRNA (guanine966-N2)-methyltransferase